MDKKEIGLGMDRSLLVVVVVDVALLSSKLSSCLTAGVFFLATDVLEAFFFREITGSLGGDLAIDFVCKLLLF